MAFKLRTALLAMALVAFISAYIGVVIRRGLRQDINVQRVVEAGGGVGYDYTFQTYVPNTSVSDSSFYRMLRRVFGDNYYGSVKESCFSSLKDDSAIETLQFFPDATHLSIIDYSVTDDTIKSIAAVKQLRSLNLFRCPINDEAVSSFVFLDNIKSLTLCESSLDDRILGQVCEVMTLEDLRLLSFALDGDSLLCLSKLSFLKSLTINSLPIKNKDLKWVAENLSLKSLVLENLGEITDDGLITLKAMQSLESLIILDCSVTPAGVELVKELLPNCTIYFSNGLLDRGDAESTVE